MNHNIIIVVSFILLVIILLGFVLMKNGSKLGTQNLQKTYNLTSEDSGKSIDINKGDIILVSLRGVDSIPYFYANPEYSLDLMKLNEHKNIPIPNSKPGLGSMESWKFTAIKTGVTKISISMYPREENPAIKNEKWLVEFEANLSIN